MITTVLTEKDTQIPLWMDVSAPTEAELLGIAKQYELHETSVHDCMDALHLPKFEKLGKTTFLIVRVYDETATPDHVTLQSMTKKIALFLGDRFLITVHRREIPFLSEVAEEYRLLPEPLYLQVILIDILLRSVESFLKPITQMEKEISDFESEVINRRESLPKLRMQMQFKARVAVIRRLLWHTMNAVQKFVPSSSNNLPICQDLKERIESLQFFADKLNEDLNNLLEIQMSISNHKMMEASNRTNEVVRFLTVVSLFFLPINFIASIYGMNFEFMPELKWKYGYFIVWAVIICVELGIFIWFRKRGLLKWKGR